MAENEKEMDTEQAVQLEDTIRTAFRAHEREHHCSIPNADALLARLKVTWYASLLLQRGIPAGEAFRRAHSI